MYLKECRQTDENTIRVLLLGRAGSGKSTLARQMQLVVVSNTLYIHRLLYLEGFDRPEQAVYYRKIVDTNIYNSFIQLYCAAGQLRITLPEEVIVRRDGRDRLFTGICTTNSSNI